MFRPTPLLVLSVALSGCLTFTNEPSAIDDDDAAVDDDDATDDDDDVDGDGDGFSVEEGDCDDTDPNRYPGAPEECDGIDSNCDGNVDADLPGDVWSEDFDGDGYGTMNPDRIIESCVAVPGYVDNDDDCVDSNDSVYPGAEEVCNGLDDDCDGQPDEDVLVAIYPDEDGDGHGQAVSPGLGCPGPEYADVGDDCNDEDPTVWEDDDVDSDLDGFDRCAGDCDDTNQAVSPQQSEQCDGLDNDCDGVVDESFQRMGIVHDSSLSAASALKTLVDDWGYCTTLEPLTALNDGMVFDTSYTALIVVHSTTTEVAGWQGPTAPFLDFHNRCLPTIGMGTGGVALFQALADTGFPTDITFANQGPETGRLVMPYSQSDSIWNTPNYVIGAGTSWAQIYGSASGLSMQSGAGNWWHVAHVDTSPESMMILKENNCGPFWLWGWDSSLGNTSTQGRLLFENILWQATGGP